MFKTEKYHEQLRMAVTAHLEKHGERYENLVDGNYHEHVENMKRSRGSREIWATECEIAATADLFEIEIKIRLYLSS